MAINEFNRKYWLGVDPHNSAICDFVQIVEEAKVQIEEMYREIDKLKEVKQAERACSRRTADMAKILNSLARLDCEIDELKEKLRHRRYNCDC